MVGLGCVDVSLGGCFIFPTFQRVELAVSLLIDATRWCDMTVTEVTNRKGNLDISFGAGQVHWPKLRRDKVQRLILKREPMGFQDCVRLKRWMALH